MCFTSRHMIGLGPMGPTSRRKHLGKLLGGFSNSFQAIVQSLTQLSSYLKSVFGENNKNSRKYGCEFQAKI